MPDLNISMLELDLCQLLLRSYSRNHHCFLVLVAVEELAFVDVQTDCLELVLPVLLQLAAARAFSWNMYQVSVPLLP